MATSAKELAQMLEAATVPPSRGAQAAALTRAVQVAWQQVVKVQERALHALPTLAVAPQDDDALKTLWPQLLRYETQLDAQALLALPPQALALILYWEQGKVPENKQQLVAQFLNQALGQKLTANEKLVDQATSVLMALGANLPELLERADHILDVAEMPDDIMRASEAFYRTLINHILPWADAHTDIAQAFETFLEHHPVLFSHAMASPSMVHVLDTLGITQTDGSAYAGDMSDGGGGDGGDGGGGDGGDGGDGLFTEIAIGLNILSAFSRHQGNFRKGKRDGNVADHRVEFVAVDVGGAMVDLTISWYTFGTYSILKMIFPKLGIGRRIARGIIQRHLRQARDHYSALYQEARQQTTPLLKTAYAAAQREANTAQATYQQGIRSLSQQHFAALVQEVTAAYSKTATAALDHIQHMHTEAQRKLRNRFARFGHERATLPQVLADQAEHLQAARAALAQPRAGDAMTQLQQLLHALDHMPLLAQDEEAVEQVLQQLAAYVAKNAPRMVQVAKQHEQAYARQTMHALRTKVAAGIEPFTKAFATYEPKLLAAAEKVISESRALGAGE